MVRIVLLLKKMYYYIITLIEYMFIFFTHVDKTLIIDHWVLIRHILNYNINLCLELVSEQFITF